MADLIDWYSLVENGISSRLRAELTIAEFITKPDQVSDNDSALTAGDNYFAIFRPGSFPTLPVEYESGKIVTVTWITYIDLYVKYQEKREQWSTFKPYRNAVIQFVMRHRFLKRETIGETEFEEVRAVDRIRSISGNDEPGYFRFFNVNEKMPPNFMTQRLAVTTAQRCIFA